MLAPELHNIGRYLECIWLQTPNKRTPSISFKDEIYFLKSAQHRLVDRLCRVGDGWVHRVEGLLQPVLIPGVRRIVRLTDQRLKPLTSARGEEHGRAGGAREVRSP